MYFKNICFCVTLQQLFFIFCRLLRLVLQDLQVMQERHFINAMIEKHTFSQMQIKFIT